MIRASIASLLLLGAACLCPRAGAQATYAGIGPGSYVSVGVTASGYESDYGKQRLLGPTLFVDANLYRRIGVEAEFRTLRYHAQENVRENTYLIGPRISTHGRSLRPYAKLLVGRGTFNFPFDYAHGAYFVAAPGAGADLRLGKSRLFVRLLDFEYQIWPEFTFGALHPYGLSTGLAFRLF